MKIALCQIDSVIGDIEGNKKKIIEWYNRSREAGSDLTVFPELSLLGYPPLDLVEKAGFRNRVFRAASEIASFTDDHAILFGSITENKDTVGTDLFNSALLCFNGKVQFVQNKTLIPNYDVFDEMRYFESARNVRVFEFKGEKLGISICEDIWNDKDYWKHRLYPNDPVERLRQDGATILLNISASPYSYGKRIERNNMLSTLCRIGDLPLAYCCAAGAQTDLVFDGASMCFSKEGKLVALGKTFEEDFLLFDTAKRYEPIGMVEGTFEEEVYKALVVGLRDYFAKMRFNKAVLGLSGGIDSALVAVIAAEALGAESVHAILLPSQYSSEGSVSDSLDLIKNLNIGYSTISIQPSVDVIVDTLQPAFAGKKPDVTEENIQSRVRGLLLMAYSNKHGHLLLTTGNKSEMAVGYCTLYGDMCGAVAVIADVYKTDVYRLANYVNRNGIVIPQAIIDKAPSAELRPDQKDEDSLPPYEVLDQILRMYLEENMEYEEIVEVMKSEETVKRVLRLVDLNEFKRRQAAPALRVSYKAFGYGRRYPIVQGWRR
jgi:NAD+ synthetase